MKLHTNMLAGINDNAVIMSQLLKSHVTHDHTWLNLNGEYRVLIVRVDMTDSGETNYLLEIWRVNVEEPKVGYQHFDRHVGMPNTDLRLEPIGGWMYPDRSALMTDLCHFIDANVHNS